MASTKVTNMNMYKRGIIYNNKKIQHKNYIKLIELVDFKKREKIFDAGCGSGIFGKHIKNCYLIGGDFNMDSYEKLEGYNKLLKCDIEKKIPLQDKEVDSVVSISVFQFIDNIDKAFEECMRVAKKRIIINIPNSKFRKLRYFYNSAITRKPYYLDTKSLRDLGDRHNLDVKIFYLSNKFNWIRRLFGDYLSGGIIGVYNINS